MTDDVFIRTPEAEIRRQLCAIARSQEGNDDPRKYWRDVLPSFDPPFPPHWCGAFYLWCLHQAGLLLGVSWVIGSGLSNPVYRLRLTTEPMPGDLAYFKRNQHYAMVVGVGSYAPNGSAPVSLVQLVNGNSRNERNKTGPTQVIINERPRSTVAAFYSIDGIIPK